MKLNWDDFKTITAAQRLDILMVEKDDCYKLYATKDGVTLRCVIITDQTDDISDFETNYKTSCNPARKDIDSSGKPFARMAVSDTGNSLQWLSFHATAGKYGIFTCVESDNTTDFQGFTYKIYDANDDEITSAANEANAVKSVITFHPQFDLEMMAASLRQIETPTSDMNMFMVIDPDENIGSKYEMVTGGHDLRFFPALTTAFVDGKAPKKMVYDPVYNTNKMAFILYHPVNTEHDIMLQLEYFRE